MSVVLGTVIFRNLKQNFLQHFLAEPYFIYDSYRKTCCSTVYRTISTHTHTHTHNNNPYLTRCQTQLHCCTNNFSGSCC
jgi:hypothetical protein